MARVEQAEILIVGGGVAGLAMAHALGAAGHGLGVMLVDREEIPGFYASGHNAGIGRQLTGRPEHTALALAGRVALQQAGLIDQSGGCLLAAEAGGTLPLHQEARTFGLEACLVPGSIHRDLHAKEHLFIPSDGIIDVDAMLRYCAEHARRSGARLHYGCAVTAIHPWGKGFEVETDRGLIRAQHLVNAAGAWAQEVGTMAEGADIPFHPYRRHLVWSPRPSSKDMPWTWWVDRSLYLRPESGGLLLCACEEDEVALPCRGQQPHHDKAILDTLSALLRDRAPSLDDIPIGRLWCGIRTFAPDRRFVIGPDPQTPRLFWLAGLGGHGMTSGLAVGHFAADVLLGRKVAGALSPERYQCSASFSSPQ